MPLLSSPFLYLGEILSFEIPQGSMLLARTNCASCLKSVDIAAIARYYNDTQQACQFVASEFCQSFHDLITGVGSWMSFRLMPSCSLRRISRSQRATYALGTCCLRVFCDGVKALKTRSLVAASATGCEPACCLQRRNEVCSPVHPVFL